MVCVPTGDQILRLATAWARICVGSHLRGLALAWARICVLAHLRGAHLRAGHPLGGG